VRITLTKVADSEIVTQDYSELFDGLESGVTYYVRVGALAVNPSSYYNYSKIIEMKIP